MLAAVLLAQAKTWTPPPTTLPKPFVEAAAFLLAHGMGDPRGGEYREATIRAAGRRGERSTTIHGWVFPDGHPARVVTTQGQVESVEGIGPRIDLAADLPRPDGQDPVFAALLLVDGRESLARRAIGDPRDGKYAAVQSLAGFLGTQLQQAVNAFARKDDAQASVLAKRAVDEGDAIEAEAKRLGGSYFHPEYFDLDLVKKIALDAPHRVGRFRPPLDFAALGTRPVDEQVSTLIDRLDDAAAHGIRIDGHVNPAYDPIVKALVAIGAPAVEPLIDCVERDQRLTRINSVSNADLETILSIVSVRRVAYVAIGHILKIQELPSIDDASALRAYWEANRSRTPAERWLAILADDKAGDLRWGEAARSLFGNAESPFRPSPLPAEALRGKSNPSLSDVLNRRVQTLVALDPNAPSAWGSVLDLSLRLSADLAIWSPATALPALRTTTRQAMSPKVDLDKLGEPFAEAVERRGDLEGDPAWDEYAAWIRRVRTEEPGRDLGTEAFRPLRDRWKVPQIREAMRAMFASSDSSWSLARRERSVWGAAHVEPYVLSPLLDDPVFLKAVLEVLEDRTPVGDVVVDQRGGVAFRTPDGSSGSNDEPDRVLKDPLHPVFDVPHPLRACDQIATVVARLKGAPAYRPYWPDATRDAALARLASFLRRKAGGLARRLPPPSPFEPVIVS